MNKQEAIEKIEKLKGLNVKDKYFILDIEMIPKGDVLEIIEQIDELEKPVVPKYVADMIIKRKKQGDSLVATLLNLGAFGDAQRWIRKGDNGDTFAKAWLYGYEVEKEKLYTVELPNHDYHDKGKFVLCKNKSGKVFIKWTCLDDWEFLEEFQLTEEEVKEKFNWVWQFAKEVDE